MAAPSTVPSAAQCMTKRLAPFVLAALPTYGPGHALTIPARVCRTCSCSAGQAALAVAASANSSFPGSSAGRASRVPARSGSHRTWTVAGPNP